MNTMKKLYIKTLAILTLATSLASCGDKFLESDVFGAIDSETALDNIGNIGYALNGTYYNFYYYGFAGTEATALGDLASDVTYWNQATNHFGDMYQFTPTETSVMLDDIWANGYAVIANATRIIVAGENLYDSASDEEKVELDDYLAEAYAMRAYSNLVLANTFCHQLKVNGQDFSAEPGIVLVKAPIDVNDMVERATLGDTYAFIEDDLKASMKHFDACGVDNGMFYFNPAAVKGLQARVYLYEEKWQEAADAAKEALQLKGITELAVTPAAYQALYAGGASNTESLFALAITAQQNWSANSSGTLWSTYSYSPSPWLQSVMADDDCRRAVWGWDASSTPATPIFNGGKFLGASGNAAYGTCYLINAPEMFLIQAEAYAQLNQPTPAADALLVVAKRNPAITTTADLPADKGGILSFVKDERARELFQEGHRLWDLRRWGGKVNVYAVEAPSVKWMVNGYDVSNAVYPIPVSEINTDMGVKQNANWASTFPQM